MFPVQSIGPPKELLPLSRIKEVADLAGHSQQWDHLKDLTTSTTINFFPSQSSNWLIAPKLTETKVVTEETCLGLFGM